MNKEEKTQLEIAAILNITAPTVGNYLRRNGIIVKRGMPVRKYKGRPGHSISTELKERLKRINRKWHFSKEQEKEIKHLRLLGKMHKDIAKKFDLPIYVIASFCRSYKIFPIKEQLPENKKRCRRCGIVKNYSEFNKYLYNKTDGLHCYCKLCDHKNFQKYLANPANYAKYRIVHKRRNDNPEIKRRRAEQQRIRRREDARFRLDGTMSSAMRLALKENKNGLHWEKLVPYSLDDLMMHLEKQFEVGMTWGNHGRGPGQWSIDHIIPKSRFNYEKPTDLDFQRCWALENLRPMWHQGSNGNASKNDKLEGDFQPSLLLEIR
jgi:predicted transcriptional regulator